MKRPAPGLWLSVAVTLAACATAPPSLKGPDDASDTLRDLLTRAPDDIKRGILTDDLETVELDRARRANSILGYRRFLDEFPHGESSATARSLLENLRFQEARQVSTVEAWQTFLDEDPRGAHAGEAHQALGGLEIDHALASSDLVVVRRVLAEFPDHPRREPLVSHEDELSWLALAGAPTTEALDGYLAIHPNGLHRVDALRRREENEQRDVSESEDLDRARARAARADATEQRRAAVAELELLLALRRLDVHALQVLADGPPGEPAVAAVQARARAFLASLHRRPFSPSVKTALAAAVPDSSLATHETVRASVQTGDPLERAAALRKLAEWADPTDVPVILAQLDAEYVGVRLQAVETLRSVAQSLKPAVWHAIERSREEQALGRELSASVWRQAAALREADGRPVEAMAAWREVLNLDGGDLAARGRVFALARASADRLASAAAARDLAKAAVEFADGRWPPPKLPEQAKDLAGRGHVVGMLGGTTILRQICTAIDLESDAAKVLGDLAVNVGPEEQELLSLARTDADRAIQRLHGKRAELEESLRAEQAGLVPCGVDPAAAPIEASRTSRIEAIKQLGSLGDRRVLAFLEGLAISPSPELRTAAAASAVALQSAPEEPASASGRKVAGVR